MKRRKRKAVIGPAGVHYRSEQDGGCASKRERGYAHHTQVRRGEKIHRTNVSFASRTIVAPQLISAAASLEIYPQPTGLVIVFVLHEEKDEVLGNEDVERTSTEVA